jgi:hypothetical protein
MKNILALSFLILSVVCNAQMPRGVEILEIKCLFKSTDSLVTGFDKSNPNSLKRLSVLDSAAKHHAQYLIFHYIHTDSLTHREYVDYPNFVEKVKPSDRSGFNGQTSEICNVETTYTIINPKYQKGTNWEEIVDPEFSYKNVLASYRNSPSHWSIATDKKYGYIGSYTTMVFYKTTKDLTQKQIDQGFLRIVCNTFNVTVFIQDPNQ